MPAIKRRAEPAKAAAGSNEGRSAKRPRKDEASDKKPKKSDKHEKPAQKTAVSTDGERNLPKKSILQDEERSFPRGGASVLTPLERKQIQIQADRDVLFEQSGQKRTANVESSDEEDGADTGEAVKPTKKKRSKTKGKADTKSAEEPGIKIEGLSYKRLVPGSLVLGQVTQITSKDIALALPNNLTGYVPLTAMSSKLNQKIEALLQKDEEEDADEDDDIDLKSCFRIGQYLRAAVTTDADESSKKKRIELSVYPSQANAGLKKSDLTSNVVIQASVRSVEDHGLQMDLGLEDQDVKGFMSSKEIGADVDYSKIQEGAVFLCLVIGTSSNGKIVKLTTDPQKLAKKGTSLNDAPSIDLYLPGTATDMLITEVTQDGLAGKVLGSLDAVADRIHSGVADSAKDLESRFKVGNKVKVRVLATYPDDEKRKINVSLLEHVLSLEGRTSLEDKAHRAPLDLLPLSSTVKEAKVTKVLPRSGLFLDVGVKRVPAFAHISRISDKKIDSLSSDSGPYAPGSVHPARVIGYNAVDGLFLVSLEPKVLAQPFLRVEDVEVGKVVKGKVEKLIINAKGVGGVLVNLAEGISGLVPEMHMADVHLQHPEKKFREGVPVTARVLSVDPEKRQMRLTLKKTLVNSDADVWSDYHKIAVGAQSPGTIINLLPNGAVVQYYGNTRGFLPASEMSEAFIKNPADHFKIGQVVNTHVLNVDPEERRMTVSCRDPSAFGAEVQNAFKNLTVGSLTSGAVLEKTDSEVTLEVQVTGLKGILKIGQLSDGSAKKDASALKQIRVGQTLHDLVILDKSEKRPLVYLSNKPSLVKASQGGTLVKSFSDVKKGAKVDGFVRNIEGERVFVQFAGGIVGLLLKNQLTDEMAKLPGFGLRKSQSISATVLAIDESQDRFLLTMKPEAVNEAAERKVAKSSVTTEPQSLVNPVDGTSTSVDDFAPGALTKARVVSAKQSQLNVRLADGVHGRIDVSELFESWDDINDKKRPTSQFKKDDVVDVRVLGVHDARTHKFLPISHRDSKNTVFELSAKTKLEDWNPTMESVKEGQPWIAFVNNHTETHFWVNLTPNIRGRIRRTHLTRDPALQEDLEKSFPIGSAIQVTVKQVDAASNKLDLTALTKRSKETTESNEGLSLETVSKGQVLPARVTKVTERNIFVQINEHLGGPIDLTELADDYSEADPSKFKKHDIIRVCILNVDAPNKKIILTARPSKTLSSSLPVADPQLSSISQVKVNDVYRGFVARLNERGVFVSLGPEVKAFVKVAELSDRYIKDWKSEFEVDQMVKGKVTGVQPELNHIQMSLKASMLDKDYVPQLSFKDMEPGMIVTGKIRKVEDFGVFIVVDNSNNVSGLCHRSEIADKRVEDVRKLYDEGDVVKAKVLKVELEKKRISFGLKASYFKDVTNHSENVDGDEDSDDDMADGIVLDGESDEDEEMDDGGVDLDNVKDMDSDASDEEDGKKPVQHADGMDVDEPTSNPSKVLSAGGFDWTGETLGEVAEDYDEAQEAPDRPKKKKKRPEIKEDRTGDLDKYGPQSVADFERQLLGEPNSSSLWIQYMAFQLQLGEVDRAREIAERALRTIHIREQEEKSNVWIALMNLENTYGSDESLEEVFKRASQYSDAQEMHEKLASIYIDSGKTEKADALFQAMIKKKDFTPNPELWLNYATFLFTTLKEPARGRALLQRATQSVPEHLHRNLTAKFAALEFNSPNGDAERGRTLFEGLLSAFPKRFDIWDQYTDLEISKGEKDNVRALFERMAGMKMKGRRAKFVFKRWLEFEEKHGDEKSVEKVKDTARKYVEGLKGGDDE